MLKPKDSNISFLEEQLGKIDGLTSILNEIQEEVLLSHEIIHEKNSQSLLNFSENIDFCITCMLSLKEKTCETSENTQNLNFLKKEKLLSKIRGLYDKFNESRAQVCNFSNDFDEETQQNLQNSLSELEKDPEFEEIFFPKSEEWANLLSPLLKSNKSPEPLIKEYIWLSFDPYTNQEKLFNKVIENQLEKGFSIKAKQYYIHHQNRGPIFAIANFKTMELTYTDSKKTYLLIRKLKTNCI